MKFAKKFIYNWKPINHKVSRRVRKIFVKVTISSVMSVCPSEWNNWITADGILTNLTEHFSKIFREYSSFVNPYPANVENMVRA